MKKRFLVVAPHPDDEILGVGGTIARFTDEGHDGYVAILTKGQPPHFSEELEDQVRDDADRAHRLLGVQETFLFDFPAAALDQVPHRDVNAALSQILVMVEPDWVFIPFGGDIHLDHQMVFLSSLVAVRPNRARAPSHVYAYETLSETNWHAPFVCPQFVPSVFIDISQQITKKLEALRMFRSELKEFPHERSAEAVEALSMLRGATVNRRNAEAFMLVRMVV